MKFLCENTSYMAYHLDQPTGIGNYKVFNRMLSQDKRSTGWKAVKKLLHEHLQKYWEQN